MKVMKLPSSVMTTGLRKTDVGGRALPQSTRQGPVLLYEPAEIYLSAGSNPARPHGEEGPVWEPNAQLQSAGNDEAVFRPQAFLPSKASFPVSPGVVARNHSSF